jgi:hypothetical protein
MRRYAALPPALGLALSLAACSSGPEILSKEGWFPKPLDVSGGVTWSATARHQISRSGPLRPEDFVDTQGNCAPGAESPTMAATPAPTPAGAPPQAGGAVPAALPGGGVALEMSECEVVRRTGAPDRVEIGANEGSERTAVITYLRGPRPGIYRFVAGRLTVVEKAPEPATPQRAARPSKPKRT